MQAQLPNLMICSPACKYSAKFALTQNKCQYWSKDVRHNEWMNKWYFSPPFYAIMLYWARDNLCQWVEIFALKSHPRCRTNDSTYWPAVQHATTVLLLPLCWWHWCPDSVILSRLFHIIVYHLSFITYLELGFYSESEAPAISPGPRHRSQIQHLKGQGHSYSQGQGQGHNYTYDLQKTAHFTLVILIVRIISPYTIYNTPSPNFNVKKCQETVI